LRMIFLENRFPSRIKSGTGIFGIMRSTFLMPVSRLSPIVIAAGFLAGPAVAADQPRAVCLNKDAQRAAVANHEAVPLAQAIVTVRAAPNRRAEVVRARLCKSDKGLVYVLTLLARNGKVTRVTIDAANGAVISGR
jgi:hypothetical protein